LCWVILEPNQECQDTTFEVSWTSVTSKLAILEFFIYTKDQDLDLSKSPTRRFNIEKSAILRPLLFLQLFEREPAAKSVVGFADWAKMNEQMSVCPFVGLG
jgi:hypothetical protein